MSEKGKNVKGEILLKSPNEVEWKIPDFFLLSEAKDYVLQSPTFPYLDGTWCLRCSPNGSVHGIYIALMRIHSTSNRNITFRLGIKGREGLEYISRMRNSNFERDGSLWGVSLHVNRAYLQKYEADISHEGEISFFCVFSSGSSKDAESQTIPSEGTWQTIISRMYDTKESTDVRFVVNGQVFEAHRWVLAKRSPVFTRLLTGPSADIDTHIVDAENVTDAGFHILLRFLYKDILETKDKKSIVEAFHCAVTYQVKDLQTKCEEEMSSWKITPDEVCILLDCGLDIPALRNNCADLLRRKGAAALSSPAFLEISPRTLYFMLESSVLENVPVLKRIKRVLEWCVHPNQENVDYANVREKLLHDKTNPLFGRLQFENLNLEEISYVVNGYHGLITPDELLCFLTYQHTRDASDLPEWCLPTSSNTSSCNT